jgi:molecular chaperone GrpE
MSHHKTRAQERIDEIDASPATLAADLEAARAERDEARTKAEEYLGALQRERAEFVNFRRRSSEERLASAGLANESLIAKVLSIADDFDRAIEARPIELAGDPWTEGIAAIDRKLRQLLESEGVKEIEAQPGTPFDPRQHEAIVNVPGTTHREGEIVDEIRRGYRLRDRVIRPALVAVASGGDAAAAGTGAPAESGDEPGSTRPN